VILNPGKPALFRSFFSGGEWSHNAPSQKKSEIKPAGYQARKS